MFSTLYIGFNSRRILHEWKTNGKQGVFQPRKTTEAPFRLFPPHDRGTNAPIMENQAYSPSKNVENEENPGITRFFRWKTTRKTVKHTLEKCFPAPRKPLFRNLKKLLRPGFFHVSTKFSSRNSKLALDFSGKRTKRRVFPFSPPCFPVSQAVFQGFPHWFPIISTVFHIP